MPTQLKRIDSEHEIIWMPKCQQCVADLIVHEGKAFCVMCRRTWEVESIECIIEERDPAERPDQVAAQQLLDTLSGPPDTQPEELPGQTQPTAGWVTDEASIQEAQSMFETWMDGYTSETNADPDINIQAVMQFLAELLVDRAAADEARGVTDTYARARDTLHRIYQLRRQMRVGAT